MIERRRITGSAFSPPRDFIHSGAALLDCVLGGGWAVGRIGNIVGDKSSGKTLLAIEACANFSQQFPGAPIWYNETEAAFDRDYAKSLGIPVDKVKFVEGCFTVEAFFDDLDKRITEAQGHARSDRVGGLYCLDSLDALSDAVELERDIDKGSFGAQKAKKLSELFRRLNKRVSEAGITVLIVSQIRDKVGVTFGETKTRAGGRSLDFYASQILWLAQVGRLARAAGSVRRDVGVKVKAQCKKNKVGNPFRDCEFPILFGYGVDDLTANLEWLKEVGGLGKTGFSSEKEILSAIKQADNRQGRNKVRGMVAKAVTQAWKEIERDFEPGERKY